jgi:hypothetical protein
VTAFQLWEERQKPLIKSEPYTYAPPRQLVRLSVLDVPDEVPCSLDGEWWGVMRTEMKFHPRGEYPHREWVLDNGHKARGNTQIGIGNCLFVFVGISGRKHHGKNAVAAVTAVETVKTLLKVKGEGDNP